MTKTLEKAWKYEKEHHLGDYGDSSEYDLECAFKSGFLAGKRSERSKNKNAKNNQEKILHRT